MERDEPRRPAGLLGHSEAMRGVLSLLDRIRRTEVPVLLQGESGTGKERVARAIHAQSPRGSGPFVSVHCAAFAESLLAAELFGHVRGAFTGAVEDRPGLFDAAHGGTLFLDEVADMSERMQALLLRALQDGEIRRVGGREVLTVDVRIVSATHKNLREAVAAGHFREDLFYRLNVIQVDLPPLRQRVEDFPLLVEEILDAISRETGKPPLEVAPSALERLARYPWPGTIRELENEIRRAATFSNGSIGAEDLTGTIREHRPDGTILSDMKGTTLREAVEQLERVLILEALDATHGNKTAAAKRLGLSWPGLQKKMRRYGML
ncbi:MAG: sigma 54-interacting transcriptional regulator [Planctomycetes bacterium]|nr:sigma 54-interacting transcriptional regulator [Planctomycetota bacterium]